MSKVSVIMPAYNAELYVKKAIESILNQSYSDFELLICDDCSTDDTFSIIQSYRKLDSRIVIFKNDKNCGYLKTSNLLFTKATGDYFIFQDADDWSHSDRINLLLSNLHENNSDMVLSDFQVTNESGAFIYDKKFSRELIQDIKSNLFETGVTINSLFFKKKVYDVIGGYDQCFDRIGSEDIHWFGLCLNQGFRVSSVHKAIFFHRSNPYSFTKNVKNIKQLYSKHLAYYMFKENINSGINLERMEAVKNIDKKLNYLFTNTFLYYQEGMRVYGNLRKFSKKAIYNDLKEFNINYLKYLINFIYYLISYYFFRNQTFYKIKE